MKNTLKKLLSVIFCVTLLFTTVSTAFAADETRTVVDSGFCGAQGENLTWTLYSDGELVISGEGEMTNFPHNSAPWMNLSSQIFVITVEEGVTYLGYEAFCDNAYYDYCYYRVNLPKSLSSIGDSRFAPTVASNSFWGRILAICYAGSEEDWNKVEVKYHDVDYQYTHSAYGVDLVGESENKIMLFNGEEPEAFCKVTVHQDKYFRRQGDKASVRVFFYCENGEADDIVFYSHCGFKTEIVEEIPIESLVETHKYVSTSVILPNGLKGELYVWAELHTADGTVVATSEKALVENYDVKNIFERIGDVFTGITGGVSMIGVAFTFLSAGILSAIFPNMGTVIDKIYLFFTGK